MARQRWVAVAVGGGLLLAGCSSRFGAPDPATREGDEVLSLWRILFVVALVIGAVVVSLIFWSLVRYRKRGDDDASQFRDNVGLEVFYTAIPLGIVAVLFGINVGTQRDVDHLEPQPAVLVSATAFQWGWQFQYPGYGITVVGDSNAPPTLMLPVGRTTRFSLQSPDVVHAFSVPDFLTKRDLVPGVENHLEVTPTRTGRFRGVCAEFCGLDHWRMTFTVEVVAADRFDAWVTEQQEATPPPVTQPPVTLPPTSTSTPPPPQPTVTTPPPSSSPDPGP